MRKLLTYTFLPLLAFSTLNWTTSATADDKPKPKAYTDPSSTDQDFVIQGEYVGKHNEKTFATQVIALGNGEFEAVGYHGGLPGAGWDGDRSKITRTKSKRLPDQLTVLFKSENFWGDVDGSRIFVSTPDGKQLFEMERVRRESPTLGAKAPEGAVILFDGEKNNRFPGSKVDEKGFLTEGVTSEDLFHDFELHLEFRIPYTPEGRGQGRGNSGLYLQGMYEVQLLDSFGLEGKDNECGGIYKIASPKENLAFPPLTWQTYDVDFKAAKFDESGKKTSNARVTIKHNGITIHENLELPNPTGGGVIKEESSKPGPIFLQNHGDPVRFRNIWVVKK